MSILEGKVFCSYCKHYKSWYVEMGGDVEECRAVSETKWSYKRAWIEYGDPKQINGDNKCRHYEPSRWFLFRKWLYHTIRKVKKWLRHPMIERA